MEKNKRDIYEEVKRQLTDTNGFLTYAMGHWDKDEYSAKNDSANTFFKMALGNIKSIVNNSEYESLWFSKDIENCENSLTAKFIGHSQLRKL